MWRALLGCMALIGGTLSAGHALDAAQRSTVTPALTVDAPRGAFDPQVSVGLFVGVRSFQNADEFVDVPYAVDDAVDLAHLFSSTLGLLAPQRVRLALSGEPQKPESAQRLADLRAQGAIVQPATYTTLMTLVARASADIGPDGLLVVSLATHGVDERLLASDSSNAVLESTSVPVNFVVDRVGASRAGRRLVLLDACRELREPGRRTGGGQEAAMSARFSDALSRAQGTVVLAATTSGGFSYDDPVRQNGVFTSAIVDGLSGQAPSNDDGFVTINTLTAYVNERVTGWVAENRQRDVAVSKGVSARVEPITLGEMPLAEHPRRQQQALTWARGVMARAVTERWVTGAMFDEINDRLADPGAALDQLMQRLKLLENLGATYASDFALWWTARGATETAPPGGPATVAATTRGAAPNLGGAGAGLLSIPSQIAGLLEETDAAFDATGGRFVDEYRFRGQQGQHVRIDMSATSGVDGFLVLLTADRRSTVAEDDDSGDGLDPLILTTLPADGEYVLLVTTHANSDERTGVYRLRLAESTAEEVAAGADALDVSSSSTGAWAPVNGPRLNPHPSNRIQAALETSDPTFGSPKYADEYRLLASRGQRIRVSMEADFDAYLMLFSGDGQTLIQSDDDGGDGSNPLLEVEFDADGEYLILATSYAELATGPYTLQVQSLLAPDVPAGGRLDADDERVDGKHVEYWVFEGTARQRVRIVMEASGFDTVLRIERNGRVLQENDDAADLGTNSAIDFRLPETGSYTVVATSYDSSAGAYTLRLTTPR